MHTHVVDLEYTTLPSTLISQELGKSFELVLIGIQATYLNILIYVYMCVCGGGLGGWGIKIQELNKQKAV